VGDDETYFGDDESPERWLPVTGPLSPARAAVVALALEQAGIEVEFLPAEQQIFPTVMGGPPVGGQRLAVREHQVVAAREIVVRTNTAFPIDDPAAAAPWPESGVPDAEEERVGRDESPEERAAEAAFEALRVRRYTRGLFIFVIGMVWTLVVLPRLREDALMAMIGVLILCAGLFEIYAALSLRRDGAEDVDGGNPSGRPDGRDQADRLDQDEPEDR
jgi:hypothetical protein